ncbi:hypothetical protein DICPUDRAFT_156229 [Dictyostelium purpureum]|uniref:Uncharacterized protein n=1 Tax=Dictyostelium purpureum TaxID=5786 RepID=F0ZW18_DICPU|nr:uncharacterized protein DICPUDRAFT_156229 [Dictyostelium purpureum]EGC31871.1 hypothetical protein DICPUDRAFT_156229 [Dictyostelium purpureum]|eukprot:XP_003291605.1 hypothetical protein DICPUDRAFT_156229 [Dictyostelium purpureum]
MGSNSPSNQASSGISHRNSNVGSSNRLTSGSSVTSRRILNVGSSNWLSSGSCSILHRNSNVGSNNGSYGSSSGSGATIYRFKSTIGAIKDYEKPHPPLNGKKDPGTIRPINISINQIN